MCLVSRSDNIWVTRFGVKVQYKHIVVLAQINLNDYSFYSFHPILIKLHASDYWAIALWNCVRIENFTIWAPIRVTHIYYFYHIVYGIYWYAWNSCERIKVHGPLVSIVFYDLKYNFTTTSITFWSRTCMCTCTCVLVIIIDTGNHAWYFTPCWHAHGDLL